MTTLTPCPSCAELLIADSGPCPWCHRAEASRPTPGPRTAVLLALGLVGFGEGCTQALYGIACADSGCQRDCSGVVSFQGTATGLEGTPFGLAAPPEGSFSSNLVWDSCTPDSDPVESVGVFENNDVPGWIVQVPTVGTLEGSGAPRITLVDRELGDQVLVEDGLLDDGLDREVRLDGVVVPGLVMRLQIAGSSELITSADAAHSLPLWDVPGATRTLTLAEPEGTLTVEVAPLDR